MSFKICFNSDICGTLKQIRSLHHSLGRACGESLVPEDDLFAVSSLPEGCLTLHTFAVHTRPQYNQNTL